MNRRRIVETAAIMVVLWLFLVVIFGLIRFLGYLFRNHPDQGVYVCMTVLYTLAFGFIGWQLSGMKSWNWFGLRHRGGWGGRIRRKPDGDESDEGGWRRKKPKT
jgi:hypothetical protein